MPRPFVALKVVLRRTLPVAATFLFLLFLLSNNQTAVEPLSLAKYHPVLVSPADFHRSSEQPLLHTEDFDLVCLESYFSHGKPCHTSTKPRIDVLWTWVNGSDPLFNFEKTKAESAHLVANRPTRPPPPLSGQQYYRYIPR